MNLRLLCISLITCTLGIHSQLIAELTILDTEGEIRILHGNKPVLQYVKTSRPVPSGLEGYFQRSGYIHPVYTPTGQEFTGDYPLDHAHQHALFFAWVKSRFKGRRVDFWNQAKQLAGIEFRGIRNISRGGNSVSFAAEHNFFVRLDNKKEDVIHETWTVTVMILLQTISFLTLRVFSDVFRNPRSRSMNIIMAAWRFEGIQCGRKKRMIELPVEEICNS